MTRGVIFDLDHTLVDSQLDFEQMRAEMQLPPGMPILEAISQSSGPHAEHCREVLLRHETAGAERATLLPGVRQLLHGLRERRLPLGIVTRNSRALTALTLQKLDVLQLFSPIFTRDDGPVKPDPWAVQQICATWQLPSSQVTMIGDYRFDIESGRAAGAKTVLLTHPRSPEGYANDEEADLVLHSLRDWQRLWNWWGFAD